jgi:hypothetical protein
MTQATRGSTDFANGVSSEAVQKATGHSWEEWFALLDGENAQSLPHAAIARLAREQFGASDWWAQSVTVGYEQARGLRDKYQKSDGYTASGSKAIAVPVERLYAAWMEAAQRASWLGDAPLTVTKGTPGKSVRATWDEGAGSKVDVYLDAKGETKSSVSVQQTKLADADESARSKAFWAAALQRLKSYLESTAA